MLPNDALSVSEFISFLNQTLDYAYPSVLIEGELANFKISKNKWVYFDLKDENSSLKFFGTVYMLNSPLEDGMMLRVGCYPRMHRNYGLSMQIQSIQPIGEGSIKRSALLLEQKLRKEGLFEPDRKKVIPYPPSRIGLITSTQSAAYADFIKILNSRWRGLSIDVYDVQVQGESAVNEINQAIDYFNDQPSNYDVLVLVRGGGSPEDLAAFSSEQVTRAVANCSIPTLVAIGHEIDVSLAELAADKRASTPSNAAELLVPDRKVVLSQLKKVKLDLSITIKEVVKNYRTILDSREEELGRISRDRLKAFNQNIYQYRELLEAFNPKGVLSRGYAIVRKSSKIIRNSQELKRGDNINIQLSIGRAEAVVENSLES